MAAVAFCVALGFGVVAPAIPLFAQEFGVGTTAAGAVVSAFALMRLVVGPLGGRFVDRVGERTALVSGLAVVAISSLLAGLAGNYPQLLILRGIGGVGSAAFTVASMSLVMRVAAAHLRGRAMSVYQSGFLIGGIVGPGLGGAVLGLSLRAPFFVYAGTLGLAMVVALIFLTRSRTPGADAEPESASTSGSVPAAEEPMAVREALHLQGYRTALTTKFAVGFAVMGLRSTLVPLLIVDAIGAARSWVGVVFLVASLGQALAMVPAGRLVDNVGRRPSLIGGALLAAAGLVVLGLADALWVVMVAMVVLAAGSALLGTTPGALVADTVAGRGGTVVAVFGMAGDLGSVLGPVAAGALAERFSFTTAFWVAAVVVAAAGAAGLPLRETRPARVTDPGDRGRAAPG